MDGKHPDKLIAAKNGSPILLGIGTNRMFVASEVSERLHSSYENLVLNHPQTRTNDQASAFSQHTKEFIALENGEMAVITPNGHSLETSRIQLAPGTFCCLHDKDDKSGLLILIHALLVCH